jgi:hypothetical protein
LSQGNPPIPSLWFWGSPEELFPPNLIIDDDQLRYPSSYSSGFGISQTRQIASRYSKIHRSRMAALTCRRVLPGLIGSCPSAYGVECRLLTASLTPSSPALRHGLCTDDPILFHPLSNFPFPQPPDVCTLSERRLVLKVLLGRVSVLKPPPGFDPPIRRVPRLTNCI